ncbi:MAG: gliding motility protein GldM, partial [Muribaculaceae bacterium]|nr:gliding motility protein GldM [Muribaculaceae bacterium]
MAAGNNITRLHPRQKMINLMYIVLTAMLALNVSSDVLEGFAQVEDGLSRSNVNIAQRNEDIFKRLEAFNEKNPSKGAEWLKKAQNVRQATASIYAYVDSLKTAIVKTADGEDGDVNNIRRQDDLDAPSTVMLNPTKPEGETLHKRLDKYREFITGLVPDAKKNATIREALSTTPRTRTTMIGKDKSWEEYMFDNKPVVAAVTLMTKLQNDIRFAEGEALTTLLSNVDARDVRVNELNAFVIPDSRLV